jgi:hypothetical protein
MKKLILILLFFCTAVYAQEYKFDKRAIYQSEAKLQETLFCNSKDGNYVLRIIHYSDGVYAYLSDLKTKLFHCFTVNSAKQVNDEYHLVFNYEYSVSDRDYYFGELLEHVVISEDDTHTYGYINVYKNKRKKKLVSRLEVKVLKANENYFYLSKYLFFHPYESNSRCNLNINGVIEEVTKISLFKSGKETVVKNHYKDRKLLSFKEVDFTIIVPKK